MKPLFTVLCAATSAIVLSAQSPNAGAGIPPGAPDRGLAFEERIRALPKRFPPELWSELWSVQKHPAYCVYRSLDTNSVTIKIKRCEPPSHAPRLVAPLRNREPLPLI